MTHPPSLATIGRLESCLVAPGTLILLPWTIQHVDRQNSAVARLGAEAQILYVIRSVCEPLKLT